MYNYFDDFINIFGGKNSSEDYWYDIAIFESIEIVNKFNRDDWEKVIQNIQLKSKIWKIRLLESFSNDSSPERIIIASNIFE
jgi:lin0188 protein